MTLYKGIGPRHTFSDTEITIAVFGIATLEKCLLTESVKGIPPMICYSETGSRNLQSSTVIWLLPSSNITAEPAKCLAVTLLTHPSCM